MTKKMQHIHKILLISLIIILFCGCSNRSGQVNYIYADENIPNQTKLYKGIESMKDEFAVYYFPLSIPEKGELSDITIFGNKIYYIVQLLKMQSNIAEVSRVYEYDTITDTTTLIHEINDPEVTWVNELRANEKKLYWTTLKNEQYTLESFELNTQRIEKIRLVSNNKVYQPIVLGGNNQYLSWYEYNNMTSSFNFMYYDILEEKVSSINVENIFFDTFDRPSINQEKGLILKRVNDKISFNLIDMNNLQIENKFNLSNELGCVFPQISDGYIVWRNSYNSNDLFIYDSKLNDLGKIDFNELNINIFSVHLNDNILYINTSKDILYCNLDNKNYSFIAKENLFKDSFLEWDYSSSKISLDKQYISLFRGYHKNTPEYYGFIIKPVK